MSALVNRPDFVIVGAVAGNGDHLAIASTDMEEAELVAWIAAGDVPQGLRAGQPHGMVRYRLGAVMRSLHVGKGSNYAEAVANLFERWTPPQHAIEAPRVPLPGPAPKEIDR